MRRCRASRGSDEPATEGQVAGCEEDRDCRNPQDEREHEVGILERVEGNCHPGRGFPRRAGHPHRHGSPSRQPVFDNPALCAGPLSPAGR